MKLLLGWCDEGGSAKQTTERGAGVAMYLSGYSSIEVYIRIHLVFSPLHVLRHVKRRGWRNRHHAI